MRVDLTRRQLKAEAKEIKRAVEQATGEKFSYCHALEAVAKKHGFRNWNTAVARLPE